MIGTALRASAAVSTLTGETELCAISSANTCNANAECTWCRSYAVADACRTLDQAAALPHGVFECDNAKAVAEEETVTRAAAIQFVSGLLLEAVNDAHLEALDACVGDAKFLTAAIQKVFTDLKVGHSIKEILHVVTDLEDVLKYINEDLAACKGVDVDAKRVWNWTTDFRNPVTFIPTAIKRIASNYKLIIQDVADITSQSTQGGYKAIGMDIAKILEIVLGPVPAAVVTVEDCAISSANKCNANTECRWCRSYAVADACRTLDQAAALPHGVFECDVKAEATLF